MSNEEGKGPWKSIAIAASVAIVAAMVFALANNGCSKDGTENGTEATGQPAAAAAETQIRFGIGAEPKTIDATKVYESAGIEVVMSYCEPLVWYDQQTLQPIPGVAERWEASQDGKTHTFHLRGNAVWWGGALKTPELVTATDFVNAWRRLLDPDIGAQYIELPLHMGIKGTAAYFKALEAHGKLAGALAQAEKDNNAARKAQLEPQVDQSRSVLTEQRSTLGFRAVDARTFVVELEDPARGKILMKLAGFPPLCPVHAATISRCEPRDPTGKPLPKQCTWTDAEHLVANGPYLITEHVLNSHFMLERNPKYWNAANVQIGRAELLTATDAVGMLRRYESANEDDALDWLGPNVPIVPDRIDQWKGHPDYRTSTLYGTYFYWLNTRQPPFNNVNVRRAFCNAIDRQAIVQGVTKGGQVPLHGLFPPLPGEYDAIPESEGFRLDPAKAQQALTAAGYPNGRGLPAITLKYNTDPGHKAIAEVVQGMWRTHLGVEVSLQNQDWPSFLADRQSGNFQIARAGWQGDFLQTHTFAMLYTSTSAFNEAKWTDPSGQLDGLVDQALRESDPAKAQDLYRRADRILVDQVAACPIYVYTKPDLVKPHVKGYVPNVKNYHPIHQLRIERQR